MRLRRDCTLSIATLEIFFGICKARRGFTVWQRAMPAPICSNIHRINEVTNNRQQLVVEGFSFYAVAEISTTGNSKLLSVRSCPGFPINSYEPIESLLNGEQFVVNPPEGSFIFIDDWNQFSIPEDVVVVGIENMENFRMIRQQRRLFESMLGDNPLLFVSRYPQSTDLRKWLMNIPNHYVHFGDFDLAGISIFLSEFHSYLGSERSSFFIPKDIEHRLKSGSMRRYNEQFQRFNHIKSDNQELQELIRLIHFYKRGYDQEGYIV